MISAATFNVMKILLATLLGILGLSATLASAQTYSVDWHKIAGGGGTSTNTTYAISGTIGQSEAGGMMTAGGYSVTGGFWSLVSVVQTPGSPTLLISNVDPQIVVSWSSSATGFTLQTNSNLSNTNGWSNYTGTVINNSVTNPSPAGTLFFRLKQ